jgi:hypothetical protein
MKLRFPMGRWSTLAILTALAVGCGDGDDDDAGFSKIPLPMDQVPAVVMKTAKETAPDLTFYAAFKDKFEGQDSIELKGKTKNGKIREIEVSPSGKLLGTE